MTKEQKARMMAIEEELEMGDMTNYDEWFNLNHLAHNEYVEAQLPELERYFNNYIKDKPFNEIEPERWDWYSDWHKDVFGFRPRQTKELGVR